MTVWIDIQGFQFGFDVFTFVAWIAWTLFLVSVIRSRERIIYRPEPSPGWRTLLHRAGIDIAQTFPADVADDCAEIIEIAADEIEEVAAGKRPERKPDNPDTFGDLQLGTTQAWDQVEKIDERRYRRTRPTAQEAADRLKEMGYK